MKSLVSLFFCATFVLQLVQSQYSADYGWERVLDKPRPIKFFPKPVYIPAKSRKSPGIIDVDGPQRSIKKDKPRNRPHRVIRPVNGTPYIRPKRSPEIIEVDASPVIVPGATYNNQPQARPFRPDIIQVNPHTRPPYGRFPIPRQNFPVPAGDIPSRPWDIGAIPPVSFKYFILTI
uniref:DUF4794 domain-containing protein n=1 Tax=Megaselia scalaris TaxID=36166 RepID=T1GUV5_MEGSC